MLVVLLIGQFMALLDVTIVNVAMPTMGVDLHASGSALQLVVSGYTVSYAMLLITGARLGHIYGRRRMFSIGVSTFTVSSLVCGFAPTATVLIVARFVQGAGAAMMMPQIMSVIQTQFTGNARAKALSAYSAVLSIGAVLGMLLGGVLVNANLFESGWRPVFLVNVPIGLVVAALVPCLVPADRPNRTRRIDFAGLAVAVPAVFLVVLPLVIGHEIGWPLWTFLAIAAGLLLAVVFVLVERRITARGGDPLLNLGVLRAPGMASGIGTLTTGMIAYGAFLFVFALHLQAGLGDSALRAGLTFIPAAATFGAFGFYWRRLPERVHHLLPPVGFGLGAVSYLALAIALHGGGQSAPLMWFGLLLFGVGMGIAFVSVLTHSLVRVPQAEAPDASGLLTTTFQLGQVIGVAVFGSVFLTLAQRPVPHSSALAISTTLGWLAVLVAVGVVAAGALARTVLRAKRAG